jgi:hypothetical protein
MKIAYGYDGITEDDNLFELATEAGRIFDETANFGVWMVDLIPICPCLFSMFSECANLDLISEKRTQLVPTCHIQTIRAEIGSNRDRECGEAI